MLLIGTHHPAELAQAYSKVALCFFFDETAVPCLGDGFVLGSLPWVVYEDDSMLHIDRFDKIFEHASL